VIDKRVVDRVVSRRGLHVDGDRDPVSFVDRAEIFVAPVGWWDRPHPVGDDPAGCVAGGRVRPEISNGCPQLACLGGNPLRIEGLWRAVEFDVVPADLPGSTRRPKQRVRQRRQAAVGIDTVAFHFEADRKPLAVELAVRDRCPERSRLLAHTTVKRLAGVGVECSSNRRPGVHTGWFVALLLGVWSVVGGRYRAVVHGCQQQDGDDCVKAVFEQVVVAGRQ